MIIGKNEMKFNGATMALIVQFYLDNKLLNKSESGPQVVEVHEDNGGMFVVSLDKAA